MSATATSPLSSRESAMRKPPGTATPSDSQVSETSTEEDLAKLAYALWEQRSCPYGSPVVDWLEAERKLRERSDHASS
jgi:Protein of unknown function (DUF2934)